MWVGVGGRGWLKKVCVNEIGFFVGIEGIKKRGISWGVVIRVVVVRVGWGKGDGKE